MNSKFTDTQSLCENIAAAQVSETFHPYSADDEMAGCGPMENATAGVDFGTGAGIGIHSAILDEGGAAPEWIELIPAGVFRGRDGRGPFNLADAAAVMEATQALRMSAGIPIDYDHATDLAAPEGRPAPAAGWIKELRERDGALWGRVQWTPHGAAAVTTREYRYISPVFEHGKDGTVTRLLRAALTNNPNLYLTAISSKEKRERRDDSADGTGGLNNLESEGDPMDARLAEIRSLLGLEQNAAADEMVAAIRAIMPAPETDANAAHAPEPRMNESAVDLGRYVPVAHFQKAIGELNALRAIHARERSEHIVAEAVRAGKIVPAQREWAIAYCAADEAGFKDFAARQPAVALGEIAFGPVRASASAAERPVDGEGRARSALTGTEQAVCSHLGLDAADYMRRKLIRGDLHRLNP
jgi:phage I-like protein